MYKYKIKDHKQSVYVLFGENSNSKIQKPPLVAREEARLLQCVYAANNKASMKLFSLVLSLSELCSLLSMQ